MDKLDLCSHTRDGSNEQSMFGDLLERNSQYLSDSYILTNVPAKSTC
jgi:hypothetical protein